MVSTTSMGGPEGCNTRHALSFADGYLLFADSRGFGLGGLIGAEDAGKLTIFLDEVLDLCGRATRAFEMRPLQLDPKKSASQMTR
jgi:hypothetical protein